MNIQKYYNHIDTSISQARLAFEQKKIPLTLLEELYRTYNSLPDLSQFMRKSQNLFPDLNCGIASLYLKHILGRGEIRKGLYGNHQHTVLLLDDQIIDITADQFGGPRIYRGPLTYPWYI